MYVGPLDGLLGRAVREAQLSGQNHTRDKMVPRGNVGPKTFFFLIKSSCTKGEFRSGHDAMSP